MRLALVLAAALLPAAPAPPAAAQGEAVEPAIGRLNRAGYDRRRHCTAALVAPREAITARHCVEGLPVEELHLLLGYDRGELVEHHRVASVVMSERADVARLCLEAASEIEPLPMAPGAAPSPMAGVLGYPFTRAHAQDLRVCALGPGPDAARVVLDCPLEQGFSGAPVRSPAPDGPVVAVTSASNATLSVAVRLSALPREGCPPAP